MIRHPSRRPGTARSDAAVQDLARLKGRTRSLQEWNDLDEPKFWLPFWNSSGVVTPVVSHFEAGNGKNNREKRVAEGRWETSRPEAQRTRRDLSETPRNGNVFGNEFAQIKRRDSMFSGRLYIAVLAAAVAVSSWYRSPGQSLAKA